jgi:hypothetical protein
MAFGHSRPPPPLLISHPVASCKVQCVTHNIRWNVHAWFTAMKWGTKFSHTIQSTELLSNIHFCIILWLSASIWEQRFRNNNIFIINERLLLGRHASISLDHLEQHFTKKRANTSNYRTFPQKLQANVV